MVTFILAPFRFLDKAAREFFKNNMINDSAALNIMTIIPDQIPQMPSKRSSIDEDYSQRRIQPVNSMQEF
ncbi:unnamed protein product [Withania somnifera]